jgi:hypothetical protein
MTAEDLNARYDPMSRDELIAECERLRQIETAARNFIGVMFLSNHQPGEALAKLHDLVEGYDDSSGTRPVPPVTCTHEWVKDSDGDSHCTRCGATYLQLSEPVKP